MVLADRFTDVENLMQGQEWGEAKNIVFFIYIFPRWMSGEPLQIPTFSNLSAARWDNTFLTADGVYDYKIISHAIN